MGIRIVAAAGGPPEPPTAINQQVDGCAVCGDAIVQKRLNFDIVPNQENNQTLECDEGYKVVGGGFTMNDDPDLVIWDNSPLSDKGWKVSITNRGDDRLPGQIHVICMKTK